MTIIHHINFTPVHLGSGWMATEAWVIGGPLVLIQAQSQTGEVLKSRLDMGKEIFIDPWPIKANEGDIRKLVATVNVAFDKPSW